MSSEPSVSSATEKPIEIAHVEANTEREHNAVIGCETDEAGLPPGYYTSTFFLGTLTAISVGFFAGVCGFSLVAPILLTVNADIGPVCLSSQRSGVTLIC